MDIDSHDYPPAICSFPSKMRTRWPKRRPLPNRSKFLAILRGRVSATKCRFGPDPGDRRWTAASKDWLRRTEIPPHTRSKL